MLKRGGRRGGELKCRWAVGRIGDPRWPGEVLLCLPCWAWSTQAGVEGASLSQGHSHLLLLPGLHFRCPPSCLQRAMCSTRTAVHTAWSVSWAPAHRNVSVHSPLVEQSWAWGSPLGWELTHPAPLHSPTGGSSSEAAAAGMQFWELWNQVWASHHHAPTSSCQHLGSAKGTVAQMAPSSIPGAGGWELYPNTLYRGGAL